jgi:glyoxylase-like metal-dependent hydrolase (beta-lactamase superfamily II)
VAAGHVKTFEGATKLFPGLRTLPAYGHTPGHTYYVLEDGGEKLVFMGDTIHAPDAQFDDPDITIAFDVDQVQAAATRRKALTDLPKAATTSRWTTCIFRASADSGRRAPATAGFRSRMSTMRRNVENISRQATTCVNVADLQAPRRW